MALLQNISEADLARLLAANPRTGFIGDDNMMMLELMKTAGQNNTGLMPVGGAASNADMELFNSLVKSNPYGLDYDQNTGMFFYGENREPISAQDYQSYIDDINRQQQEIYNRDEKPINTIMNKAGDAFGGLLDIFR